MLARLGSNGRLAPSLRALVGALWGDEPPSGRLPVEVAGLSPRGHGLSLTGVVPWH